MAEVIGISIDRIKTLTEIVNTLAQTIGISVEGIETLTDAAQTLIESSYTSIGVVDTLTEILKRILTNSTDTLTVVVDGLAEVIWISIDSVNASAEVANSSIGCREVLIEALKTPIKAARRYFNPDTLVLQLAQLSYF